MYTMWERETFHDIKSQKKLSGNVLFHLPPEMCERRNNSDNLICITVITKIKQTKVKVKNY